MIGPSRIIAELRGAEQETLGAAVKGISGVRSVEDARAGNWTRLVISGDSDADLRAEVFKLTAAKGWQLRELRREVGSLEDFFVQITYEQNVRAGERMATPA